MSVVVELYQQAQVALYKREYEKAHQCLMALLRHDDSFADAYFLLGRLAHEFQNYNKEIEMLTQALQRDGNNAEYLACIARAYATKGDTAAALTWAEQAAAQATHTAESLNTLGIVFNRLSLYARAVEYFHKAVALNSENAGMYFNLASSLKFCGDFEGARQAYENAIRIKKDYYKAHAALTSLGGITEQNNHIDRLRDLIRTTENPDDLLHLSHALSKELEALARYDESFKTLQLAKKRKLQSIKYQFDHDDATFKALHSRFASHNSATDVGCAQAGPIFVVGMPRSGTTLVERILSSHSQIATAGELPNFALIGKKLLNHQTNTLIDASFVQRADAANYASWGEEYIKSTQHLREGKAFLIDKLPLNVLYAGYITQALPKAKILCLNRDSLDTITSNFRQLFSFHDMTYGYSLDIADTAKYCMAFKRLVDLWQAQFSQQFHIVHYETLVNDPEPEIRGMLEFLGLGWEESCLHMERNQNPVATASSVQVRSPISTHSVGQWRHYDAFLAEAKRIVAAF